MPPYLVGCWTPETTSGLLRTGFKIHRTGTRMKEKF